MTGPQKDPSQEPEEQCDVAGEKLDPSVVAGLYVEHADSLRRFVFGVLRDWQLTQDVLQATFVKMVEQGHTTRRESRKAWLFRVAYHEALAIRRRQSVGQRAVERSSWNKEAAGGAADEPIVRFETVEVIRQAMEELPAEQLRVVQMRIYEDKKFTTIAEELGIPLGTALGRMRAAMQKLRDKLEDR